MMRSLAGRRSLPEIRSFFAFLLGGLCWGIAAFYPSVVFGSPTPAERGYAQATRIRVRLLDSVPEVRVRGLDLKIHKRGSSEFLKTDLSSEWIFRCVRGGVHAQQLMRKGEPSRAVILGAEAIVHTPAGFLNLNGRPYREEVRIYSGRRGCEVVNHLDLEKYLDGLVNAEFSARWNEEAIAAQVVAARTYAMYQMQAFRNRHYDVESDVTDQVYDGSAIEDFRAARAVARSRGWVLTVGPSQSPKPLKAFYHSTCGGSTELPQKVWGKPHPGFRRSVTCRFCQVSPKFRWQVTLDSAHIVSSLIRGVRAQGLPADWPKDAIEWMTHGKLIGLAADRVNEGGRVEQVTVVWSRGKATHRLSLPGARFRSWIGAAQIQSAAFRAVAVQGTRDLKWVFEGRGYGHGVGMCQWGAKVMGEKGYTMAQILKHYYPDAVLRKM